MGTESPSQDGKLLLPGFTRYRPDRRSRHQKAFAMAILESAFAIGIPVDIQKMEQLEGDSLLVEASRYVKIPINKVCQCTRELTTRRGYRVYILCQVANDVHEQPKFKSFNCITNKEEE